MRGQLSSPLCGEGMKTIPIPIDKVVQVVENHGGYKGGECLACGALGWLEMKYGSRFGADVMSNRLIHKRECPMNEEIG